MANPQFRRSKSLSLDLNISNVSQPGLLLLSLVLVMAFLTGVARAQNATNATSYLDHFDDKSFAELNSADSPDAPPVKTKITSTNWQQYRKFLPVGVQAFFSGRYFWQIGSGPDHYIEVVPQ